ncbi:MAG: hypothetical protein AAF065_05640 [Verrucomicrobiota bacterium]
MRFVLLGLFLFAFTACAKDKDVGFLVDWLLEDEERLEDVRFADVVAAVSGKSVFAVNPENGVDALLLAQLQDVLGEMLLTLNAAEHPVQKVGRVNEVSRHVEDFLLKELDLIDGQSCGIPPNASGELQRSGYPDLRFEHDASGRIFYLDPKVYKAGSETSSFRTFYFEPKKETNKILDDASHLIIGIAHSGKVDGLWKFDSWKVVDLIDFRVRLKAEFQSSNRELYREDAVLLKSQLEE